MPVIYQSQYALSVTTRTDLMVCIQINKIKMFNFSKTKTKTTSFCIMIG